MVDDIDGKFIFFYVTEPTWSRHILLHQHVVQSACPDIICLWSVAENRPKCHSRQLSSWLVSLGSPSITWELLKNVERLNKAVAVFFSSSFMLVVSFKNITQHSQWSLPESISLSVASSVLVTLRPCHLVFWNSFDVKRKQTCRPQDKIEGDNENLWVGVQEGERGGLCDK